MEISWRRAEPKETNYELLSLGISLTALGLSAGWFALGLPWPACAFHSLTGLPCLTCGATRAAIQFLHGHFFSALRWNPFVFVALFGLSIFNAYAVFALAMRGPRLRLTRFSQVEKKVVRFAIVCLLAGSWLYSLGHWHDF